MRIVVNGQELERDAATLSELWRIETAELEVGGPEGFAIALNGAVVRRAEWAATRLREGDRVEIIRAMQGG